MSEANPMGLLAAALAAAQGEIVDPRPNKSANIRGRTNHRFAGLDDILAAVRPVLSRHGLAITQTVEVINGDVFLCTRLLHTSGAQIVGHHPMKWEGGPQDHGAEITYSRRQALAAIVGVTESEDDDAASAQRSHESSSTSSTSRPAGAGGAPPQVSPPRGGSVDDLERRSIIADIIAAVPAASPPSSARGVLERLKAKHGITDPRAASVDSLRALLADVQAAIPEPGSDAEIA